MASENKRSRIDRRVVRTRRAIHDAFAELIQESDYSKITITELAKRADIDRKTFYTHYSSIDNLLEDIIRENIDTSLQQLNIQGLMHDPKTFIKKYLFALAEALPDTREQGRSMFSHLPLYKFMHYTNEITEDCLEKNLKDLSEEDRHYCSLIQEFYLGGLLHAYLYWMTDKSELTLDQAIDILSENAANGISGLIARGIVLSPTPSDTEN